MTEESGTFCGECGPRRYATDDSVDKTLEAGIEEPTRGRYTLIIHCVRCNHTSLATVPDDEMQEEYEGPGPAPISSESFDTWKNAAMTLDEKEGEQTRKEIEDTLEEQCAEKEFEESFEPVGANDEH